MIDPAALGFFLSLIAMLLGYGIVRLAGAGLHPMSTYMVYAYAHAVIFLLRPFYIWRFGDGKELFQGIPVADAYVVACLLAGVGYVGFSIGYAISSRGLPSESRSLVRLQPIDASTWRRLRPWLWAVAIGGAALYAQYIRAVGWRNYLGLVSAGRSEELTIVLASVSGYYSTGLQFTLGALLLMVTQSAASGRRGMTALHMLLLIVAVLPQVATGSRSVFVPVAVALLAVFVRIFPGAFTRTRLAVFGPVAFILLFIMPKTVRNASASGESIGTAASKAFTPKEIFENFVGGFDTAMLDAFTRQISATWMGWLDLMLGRTYASPFTTVVPSEIWPDKPLSIDQQLNAVLFPDTFRQGVGFSFGVYSEPFANFSYLGVAIISIALGVVFAHLGARRFSGGIVGVWVYVMTVAYVFPIVRGSVSFDVQRALISVVPVLLAIWWTNFTAKGKPRIVVLEPVSSPKDCNNESRH